MQVLIPKPRAPTLVVTPFPGARSPVPTPWQSQQRQPQVPVVQARRRHSTAAAADTCTAEATAYSQPQPDALSVSMPLEDKWIGRAVDAFNTGRVPEMSSRLGALRSSCLETLQRQRMPNKRQEEYRFTDLAPILKARIQVVTDDMTAEAAAASAAAHPLQEAEGGNIVVRNGVMDPALSNLTALPEGVFFGRLADAPSSAAAQLGAQSSVRGGPFAVLNGATVSDAVCLVVPPGVQLELPLHILNLTTGGVDGGVNACASRVLVCLGAGASASLVEEYGPAASGNTTYFNNTLAEVFLAEDAHLTHGYVELEGTAASHVKATLVEQSSRSHYVMTEAALGASLSRHDLTIEQAGEQTVTELRHFMLAGEGQVHDLHSKVRLDFPGGQASQLHKCIVSAASGRGIFDGSVKVERLAQKTDAKQLSRNLLLVPRATVNVKPNLQIVADDVKCTHGCTVSDLEEKQLFYFRSRGLDQQTARQMLVYSFGKEVTQHLGFPQLQARIEDAVNATLAKAPSANLEDDTE